MELVGGKYLSWVRVLRKKKKKKGLGSIERENWREYWSCRALGAGVGAAGVLELGLVL